MSSFTVHYRLTLFEGESVDERFDKICREQSAELPADVVNKFEMSHIVGQVQEYKQIDDRTWTAQISWPHELIGDDVSQFINILFGNISLMPGNQITGVDWASLPPDFLSGPRFGISGIRELWGIHNRALTCTALKPVGFSTGKLASLCYQFASGGIDIIKDDHGLANQETSTFENRVSACTKAIHRAAEHTGSTSHYFPNITSSPEDTIQRLEFAIRKGCSGVLISPHLTGLAVLRELTKYNIPIMAHPAFSGQLVMNPTHGFTVPFLYGSLWRALGADFSIYPNAGGRFSFSEQLCHDLNTEARKDLPIGYAQTWPTPGGGIQRDSIPYWLQSYGIDTVFLAGGSLYQHPDGIEIASKEFVQLVQPSTN